MSQSPHYSHVGLGINALHTCKVLRAAKIRCDVVPVWTAADVLKAITARPSLTHCVVEAPFLAVSDLLPLINQHADIEFSVRCHSQIGFLQVEPGAISLVRDYLRLQDSTPNFRLAANSDRLGQFWQQVFNSRVLLLPNIYYLDPVARRVWRLPAEQVKVGSFGAIRLLKNHISAAAAALMLAKVHRLDLQFSLSVAREEHGKGVLAAIRNLFAGVPGATLIEVPWSPWSDFRQQIADLDLHMQVSMSETFNLTTADAASELVPTVSGEALDWVPSRWVAQIDDVNDIARVGWQLASDPHAGPDGFAALQAFNARSLATWLAYLGGNAATMPHPGLG